MLDNKDFTTWHLIGWQHSHQPIRSHVRKSLLTNMEFNMDFYLVTPSPGYFLLCSQLWWTRPHLGHASDASAAEWHTGWWWRVADKMEPWVWRSYPGGRNVQWIPCARLQGYMRLVKINSPGWVREWLDLTAFLGTVDSKVHISHISHVTIAYTLQTLSSLT